LATSPQSTYQTDKKDFLLASGWGARSANGVWLYRAMYCGHPLQ